MTGWPSPAAWVILLQAGATYASLYSAWCFALPVIHTQKLEFTRDTLAGIETDDTKALALVKKASGQLDDKLQAIKPGFMSLNVRGYIWVGISLALFAAAFILQLVTDPAFTGAGR